MFGIYTQMRRHGQNLGNFVQENFYKFKKGKESFIFNKQKYNYFIHPYNCTWKNERIVEIPIIQKILEENEGKEILEVGNVTNHYMSISHDVLDKYEVSKGVINKDVINFKSSKKYDLIFCISTLEHVGFDEKIKDSSKVLKAIANLKKLLTKNGQIVITHPLGYNKKMDDLIKQEKIKFNQVFLMVRKSSDNIWKQIPWRKNDLKYGSPYPCANGLLVGVIK